MYSVAIYFKEVASYNPEINDLRYVNFVLITYRAVASDVTILRNPLPCGKTVSVARVLQVDMVHSCCAYNCTARDNKTTREVGVHFYRIPQNKAKRTLWVNAINRKGFNPSSSTVICSQHFVGGS